jgi:hypothetical protein
MYALLLAYFLGMMFGTFFGVGVMLMFWDGPE